MALGWCNWQIITSGNSGFQIGCISFMRCRCNHWPTSELQRTPSFLKTVFMSWQSDSLWSLSRESIRSENRVTTVSQVSWLCFGNWNLSATGRASFELELLIMSKPDRNIFATVWYLSKSCTGLQILHSDGLIITLHGKPLLLTWNLITFYGLEKAVESQV